jgi:hypothetical protein
MKGILTRLIRLNERELFRLSDAIDEELQRRVEGVEALPALPDSDDLLALEGGHDMAGFKPNVLAMPPIDVRSIKPRRVA